VSKRAIIITRTVVLAVGAVLLVLGVWRGELIDIMEKGTAICLECIGIG
jgi:uncharacterized membrane protein YiaA